MVGVRMLELQAELGRFAREVSAAGRSQNQHLSWMKGADVRGSVWKNRTGEIIGIQ